MQVVTHKYQELSLDDLPSTYIGKDAENNVLPDTIKRKEPKSFFISVAIHGVLLTALIMLANTAKLDITPKINEVKAIKGYLYKRPVKKPVPIQTAPKTVTEKQATKPAPPVKRAEPVEIKTVAKQSKNNAASPKTSQTPAIEAKPEKTNAAQPKAKSFSAYGQLNKLRNSINQQMLEQDFQQYQAVRSHSKMHAQPFPVPHSEIQLTPEQIKEKNTSNYGGGSITKLDNGLCIIKRDQFIGSPVEASTSAFSCGESKFDASFREHMKKVQEKLAPVKPKQ